MNRSDELAQGEDLLRRARICYRECLAAQVDLNDSIEESRTLLDRARRLQADVRLQIEQLRSANQKSRP
jgi:hypothetical protein